jgi:hypothetical protein
MASIFVAELIPLQVARFKFLEKKVVTFLNRVYKNKRSLFDYAENHKPRLISEF